MTQPIDKMFAVADTKFRALAAEDLSTRAALLFRSGKMAVAVSVLWKATEIVEAKDPEHVYREGLAWSLEMLTGDAIGKADEAIAAFRAGCFTDQIPTVWAPHEYGIVEHLIEMMRAADASKDRNDRAQLGTMIRYVNERLMVLEINMHKTISPLVAEHLRKLEDRTNVVKERARCAALAREEMETATASGDVGATLAACRVAARIENGIKPNKDG